jgi:hypothetical protein
MEQLTDQGIDDQGPEEASGRTQMKSGCPNHEGPVIPSNPSNREEL